MSAAVWAGAVSAVVLAMMLREARTPRVDLSRRDRVASLLHPPSSDEPHLRFAIATMVSAETTFSTYHRLVSRIGRDVGLPETLVLRPSYADVRREIEAGRVDVALVCTGTYIHAFSGKRLRLLVQPEFEKGLEYRSLLLVPMASPARTPEDLEGCVIAFTDRESNTGCLVPTAMLLKAGHDPMTFFRKVIFTGSHDRSIQAVATGVVDAAAVDSLVWESNRRTTPVLADRVRVLWRSEAFGPPPIVVPTNIDPTLERSLRRAFLALHQDEEGRRILSEIGIRRFVEPKPEMYRSAWLLYQQVTRARRQRGAAWP